MEQNPCLRSIYRFRRIICICLGVLNTVPWMYLTYQNGFFIYRMGQLENNIMFATATFGYLICYVANIVFSAIMVFGAIKRIANYMLPWLAVHFVQFMQTIAMATCQSVMSVFYETDQYSIIILFIQMVYAVVLIFSLGSVHLYWKSLITPPKVQPSRLAAEESLMTRNETTDQIV